MNNSLLFSLFMFSLAGFIALVGFVLLRLDKKKFKKLAQWFCGKSKSPDYYLGYAFGYHIVFWILLATIFILFNSGVQVRIKSIAI